MTYDNKVISRSEPPPPPPTADHQDVARGKDKGSQVVMSDMTIESAGEDGTLRTIFTAPGRDIAYEMNGRFDSPSGRIRLVPGEWISDRPSYW